MTFLSNQELAQLKADYPDEYNPDDCPTCHNAGHFTFAGEERSCKCSEQKRLLVRYLHAGIGLRFQRLMWSDLAIPGEQLDPAIHYLDNDKAYIDKGIGLFITGSLGTGKTMLANLLLKELVKKDISCYATTFSQTIESFTAGWSSLEEKNRFAKRFMHTRVLLLDDLGKEFRRSNRLHATTFDHILRERVQNNRPTILTTNMSVADVMSGYGASILSLLREQSIVVTLSGADFRSRAYDRTIAEVEAHEVRPIT